MSNACYYSRCYIYKNQRPKTTKIRILCGQLIKSLIRVFLHVTLALSTSIWAICVLRVCIGYKKEGERWACNRTWQQARRGHGTSFICDKCTAPASAHVQNKSIQAYIHTLKLTHNCKRSPYTLSWSVMGLNLYLTNNNNKNHVIRTISSIVLQNSLPPLIERQFFHHNHRKQEI